MKVKHQHYVPRFYLKRFTIDGERLYVYDKTKEEVRGPENIKNVAQERFFYDMPADTIPPDYDPQFEEHMLSQLEPQFSAAVESAFRVVEGKGANLQERMDMAMFVAFQIMRTRAERNSLVEFMTDAQEELLNTVLRIVSPRMADQFRAEVHYDAGAAATLHAQQMWNMDLMTGLTYGLYHHLWFIG